MGEGCCRGLETYIDRTRQLPRPDRNQELASLVEHETGIGLHPRLTTEARDTLGSVEDEMDSTIRGRTNPSARREPRERCPGERRGRGVLGAASRAAPRAARRGASCSLDAVLNRLVVGTVARCSIFSPSLVLAALQCDAGSTGGRVSCPRVQGRGTSSVGHRT